jgi:hypothetical protein
VKWWVQFTARKKDRVTGERQRWRAGPYAWRARAARHARKMARHFGRAVRVEVVPPERGWH